MSTVKRVAPRMPARYDLYDRVLSEKMWLRDCLQDLAAGRHAVGCGCQEMLWEHLQSGAFKPNACSEIVRCALEMRDYSV